MTGTGTVEQQQYQQEAKVMECPHGFSNDDPGYCRHCQHDAEGNAYTEWWNSLTPEQQEASERDAMETDDYWNSLDDMKA